jgi:hypothetical protein
MTLPDSGNNVPPLNTQNTKLKEGDRESERRAGRGEIEVIRITENNELLKNTTDQEKTCACILQTRNPSPNNVSPRARRRGKA